MIPFGRHQSGSVLVLFLVTVVFVGIRFATASADAKDEIRRFISPQNIRRGWKNPLTAILLLLFVGAIVGLVLALFVALLGFPAIGERLIVVAGYCFVGVPIYLGVIVVSSIARDVFWPSRRKRRLPEKLERDSTP